VQFGRGDHQQLKMLANGTPHQCSTANVGILLFILAGHYGFHTFARSSARLQSVCVAVIALACCIGFAQKIAALTFMHQLVGMCALEWGARMVDRAAVTVTSRGALVAFGLLMLPNFLVTANETFFGFNEQMTGMGLRPLNNFKYTPFYRKQHCMLHAALSFLICSVATSFWKRWRHSHEVQLVRTFMEPACLVTIAMIVGTHDHSGGASSHGHEGHEHHEHLPSHPVISNLMCITALTQVVTNVLHLSYPVSAGGTADISLKGGSAPVLKLCRLANAFAHLVLAHFLFIDTFFEYLGCRLDLLMVGPPDGQTRQGLTVNTEVSTYLACSVMLAALVLSSFILRGDEDLKSKALSTPDHEDELAPVLGSKV